MLLCHFRLAEKIACLDKEREVENEETGHTGPEDSFREPREINLDRLGGTRRPS